MKYISVILFMLLLPFKIMAQADSTSDTEDIDESDIRENPVIDWNDEDFDITIPSFVKSAQNEIRYNGANWSDLRKAIANASVNPISVVHIGDSHIQADFATSEVRDNLQFDYGNAGRGLITPLKISGTNQPVDYEFSSTQPWDALKFMRQSWNRTMGFTGTSITPANKKSNFLVSTSEREDFNPFSAITVFHQGQFFVTSVTDADGKALPFVAEPSKDYTHIVLTEDVTAARIYFDSAGDLTLFGVNLSGMRPGLFYHTIGNNGATYNTYNKVGTVGQGIQPLSPDLVIISLGTNEAFGTVNKRLITESIDRLVSGIKTHNPEAQILLVTPMECQRIHYTNVKTSKGKRKKSRRTSYTRKKSYKINDNITIVRDAILDYADDKHIAVYDWYSIAGGKNASEKWIANGLFSGDRVHLSHKGYRLQGLLLYQALRNAFTN